MFKKLFLMLILGVMLTSVSYAQTAAPVTQANEEVAVDNAKAAKPSHKGKASKKKKKKHAVSKKESITEKK